MDAAFEFAIRGVEKKKINTKNNIYIWDGIKFHIERTVYFVADEIGDPKHKKDITQMFKKREKDGDFH